MLEEYNKYKNKFEEIYDYRAEGVKVRSKILWYEEEEKSSNCFLKLEKTKAVEGIIQKHEIESKEINDPNDINNEIDLLKSYSRRLWNLLPQVNNLFENFILPVLTQEQKKDCEKEISEKEVTDALKSFSNNKSPRNHGLTKEFCETF